MCESWLTGFFPFNTLNVSVNCLLAFKISNEKFADFLFEDLFYVITSFSLAALEIYFSLMSWTLGRERGERGSPAGKRARRGEAAAPCLGGFGVGVGRSV